MRSTSGCSAAQLVEGSRCNARVSVRSRATTVALRGPGRGAASSPNKDLGRGSEVTVSPRVVDPQGRPGDEVHGVAWIAFVEHDLVAVEPPPAGRTGRGAPAPARPVIEPRTGHRTARPPRTSPCLRSCTARRGVASEPCGRRALAKSPLAAPKVGRLAGGVPADPWDGPGRLCRGSGAWSARCQHAASLGSARRPGWPRTCSPTPGRGSTGRPRPAPGGSGCPLAGTEVLGPAPGVRWKSAPASGPRDAYGVVVEVDRPRSPRGGETSAPSATVRSRGLGGRRRWAVLGVRVDALPAGASGSWCRDAVLGSVFVFMHSPLVV